MSIAPERVAIQVVLALPDAAHIVDLEVPPGTTVLNAVERSQLVDGGLAGTCGYGIFGERCRPETLVRAGDRVEIYRPMSADPKALRRRRALRQAQDAGD